MAPVGQTWLHRVQFNSHQPIFEIMIGVQSPSTPASKRLGWSTLVGQTRMHWSHLMQRRRDSSSATDPGGRITARLKFFRTPPESRAIGKNSAPKSPARINWRRPTAGAVTSLARRGRNRNDRASCGQSSMQLKQTKHSLLRRSACGSLAPSQLLMQRSQSVHRTGSRSIRQSENRLNTPSNAPRGQMARQKKRGIHQLATRKPTKIRPTTQPNQYSRGSVYTLSLAM